MVIGKMLAPSTSLCQNCLHRSTVFVLLHEGTLCLWHQREFAGTTVYNADCHEEDAEDKYYGDDDLDENG